MPTPHGSRGGMAFSAEELCVLRRALACALQSAALPAQEIRECLHLALAVDDATREGRRLRDFLFADVARYRDALPGSATGYLARLRGALDAGYVPADEDVTALRRLCADRTGAQESARRMELLVRAALPVARRRLLALPGGLAEAEEEREPRKKPAPGPVPAPPPASPEPARERPARRPVPTPGEVFPPRRGPRRPEESHALTA
ncbi:hypothetical protein WDH52_15610 [Streptomyces sp. TRM70308]|uniref:hypothetical protein n=1 Tax=Streptomyces sp. TRM70308 TaxID=3131932 RepID=UPI003D078C53